VLTPPGDCRKASSAQESQALAVYFYVRQMKPVADLPAESASDGLPEDCLGTKEGVEAPRVLVAGSDSPTRNGIRMALEEEGVVVCGRVATAAELVEGVRRLEPDLCLVDVDLPGGGLAALAELRAWRVHPAVVLLAAQMNEEDFLKAMRLGAHGYLPKNISPSRLPAVVRAVLLGEPAIPRSLVAVLMNRLRAEDGKRHLMVPDGRGIDLSGREWEVLEAMREGLTTREIAGRLMIADVTVRRHIGAVLRKLQVQSRREALELLHSA
jgi:DNA-binding NarL/FixJ family response regulator